MITRKNIVFSGVYFLALILLAITGYLLGEYSDQHPLHHAFERQQVPVSDVVFYELPRMNLSLASSSNQGVNRRVRIDMSLEVARTNMERLKDYQPRITDRLIGYIRKQDPDVINEPQNQMDFRKDLLQEANKASYPVPIIDVVFRQFVLL